MTTISVCCHCVCVYVCVHFLYESTQHYYVRLTDKYYRKPEWSDVGFSLQWKFLFSLILLRVKPYSRPNFLQFLLSLLLEYSTISISFLWMMMIRKFSFEKFKTQTYQAPYATDGKQSRARTIFQWNIFRRDRNSKQKRKYTIDGPSIEMT